MRWLLLTLMACNPDGPGDLVPAGELSGGDRYDLDHLTVVEATLAPDVWDTLRHESRLFYELLLGPECFDAPIPQVFEWHPGEVVVDGEPLSNVGFRKKGLLGSMSWTRPSIKIDTDRFEPGQEFADSLEHLTLNNNNQDPSRVHTCMAYEVFRAAGVPAPLCAMATLEVNGQYKGVFSNVEPIKKAFLRRNFGSDDGDLYEGTASDFNDDFIVTFDIKSEGSTLDPLLALQDALALPDDALIAGLEAVLDLDGFITFWATEGFIGHWDGYAQGSNNYYIYNDPADGRLKFIPWGADAVFEDPESDPLFTASLLVQRLWNHPDGQQRYLDETRRLLNQVWDKDWLLGEVDAIESLITPHLLDPDLAEAYIETVRDFIRTRKSRVRAVLESPPQRPEYPKEKFCVEPNGSVYATFETEWDTLEADAMSYPTTLAGSLDGLVFDTANVGSVAGVDGEGNTLLQVMSVDAYFTELTVFVILMPERLGPGTWPVDVAAVPGYVVTVPLTDPFAEPELVGLMGGQLTLDEVSYTSGAAITGSLDALIIPNFFE